MSGTKQKAVTQTAPPLADPEEELVRDVARNRDLLLRLLSVNASLAGLCLAGLGFIEFGAPKRALQTLADEAIAVCTLLYVGNVYLILWALRTRNRLMHDGLSFTKQEAIARHQGQALAVTAAYNVLTDAQKAQLLLFLDSL